MSEPPDVLDRIRTREVTGVFHSRKALDAAAQDLLSSGFDRADIDVSASPDEQQRRLNYQAIPAADLADIPAAARRPYVGGDDRLGLEVVTASVVGCVVALVMAAPSLFSLFLMLPFQPHQPCDDPTLLHISVA